MQVCNTDVARGLRWPQMLVEKQNTVKSTRFDGFWTLDSLLVSGKVWLSSSRMLCILICALHIVRICGMYSAGACCTQYVVVQSIWCQVHVVHSILSDTIYMGIIEDNAM